MSHVTRGLDVHVVTMTGGQGLDLGVEMDRREVRFETLLQRTDEVAIALAQPKVWNLASTIRSFFTTQKGSILASESETELVSRATSSRTRTRRSSSSSAARSSGRSGTCASRSRTSMRSLA